MSRKEDKQNGGPGPAPKDTMDPASLLKKLTPKLIKSGLDLGSSRGEEGWSTPRGGSSSQSVQDTPLGETPPPPSSTSDKNTWILVPPGHTPTQGPCDAPSSPAPSPTPSHAVPVGGAEQEDVPDWYEELSDDHVTAFKEVFDMLDSSKTGSLNADSLFEGLRRVDSEITREEVESVLKTLDKDGNGEIDFEEFLYHISHSGAINEDGGDDRKRRGAFTRRQRLFYTAITEFTIKRTLMQIQHAQMARVNQPHVLSHYTAGARLIGLTDRQLANEMKRMQKNMKQQDSPYAKPLQLVVSAGGRKTVRKAIRPRRKPAVIPAPSQVAVPAVAVPSVSPVPVPVPVSVPVPISIPQMQVDVNPAPAVGGPTPKLAMWSGIYSKVRSIATPPKGSKDVMEGADIRTIQDVMCAFGARDSVFSKLPDAHKILELREKLAHSIVAEKDDPAPVTTETTDSAPSAQKPKRRRKYRIVKGWTIPRVDRDKVPLPVLKIKYKHHRPTIEDLPNIREKVAQAIADYYESLRQATVKNAWEHWEKLYSHRIRSHKLVENFREVYRAYSPHKEEEAFVVCPWVPGPFRHIKHSNRWRTAGYTHPLSPDRHRPNTGHQPTRSAPPGSARHQPISSAPPKTGSTSGRTSRTEQRPASAL